MCGWCVMSGLSSSGSDDESNDRMRSRTWLSCEMFGHTRNIDVKDAHREPLSSGSTTSVVGSNSEEGQAS